MFVLLSAARILALTHQCFLEKPTAGQEMDNEDFRERILNDLMISGVPPEHTQVVLSAVGVKRMIKVYATGLQPQMPFWELLVETVVLVEKIVANLTCCNHMYFNVESSFEKQQITSLGCTHLQELSMALWSFLM